MDHKEITHNKKALVAALVTFGLFLLLLPISSRIDFFQNDDWVFYENVKMFLEKDFTLHAWVAPTFYVQGFLALAFAKFFTLSKLPVLTLLMSVGNFFLLTLILLRFFRLSTITSVLAGLLLFLNPVSLYLAWGFMSAHYFLFFCMTAFYIFLKIRESQDRGRKLTIYLLLVILLALLTRQVAMVLPLSISLYYFLNQERKKGALFLITFLIMYVYIQYIFPKTFAMSFKTLIFKHLWHFDYVYALVYGVLLWLTAMLIPLVVVVTLQKVKKLNKRQIALWITVSLAAILFLNNMYKPETISWGEFPYFENTFERTGFYPRGIDGTKYHFARNYDLFRFWDLSSKIILGMYLSTFLFNKKDEKASHKRNTGFFLITFFVYMGVMIIAETFYDRYIIYLIPVSILYLFEQLKKDSFLLKLSLLLYGLFLFILGYQLSMDFVLVNDYVWQRSWQVVEKEHIFPKKVYGTYAWRRIFENEDNKYDYYFTYDSPLVNKELLLKYELIEEKHLSFPASIFIDPKIHLYKSVR